MRVVSSDCCDCGLPCRYEACRFYKVIRYICDRCEEEHEELYHFGPDELCLNCIKELLERVEYYD
jgi:hypothetical protein